MFRGVPGFLEGVPGCSGFSRRCSGVSRVFSHCPGCSGVFRGVPGCSGVPCSGVPVFQCSWNYYMPFLNEISKRLHVCRVVNTGDFKSEEPGSSQVGGSYFSFVFFCFSFFCNLSDFYYLFSFRS